MLPAQDVMLDARDVARELLMFDKKTGQPDVQRLRRKAKRGDFPQLLKVDQRQYLVRRAQFEDWKAGRWTMEEATRTALVVETAREAVRNRRSKKGSDSAWG